MGDNRSQTVKNAETGQMEQGRAWSLHIVLEKIDELASRRPSLNEIGLMRYFCNVIRSRCQELRCYNNITSEIERLIGEAMSCSTIGQFNIGQPHHCSKGVYILLMSYARALKLKVPDILTDYYTSLLKENDQHYQI